MSDSDMNAPRHFNIVTHVHGCFECPDAVVHHGLISAIRQDARKGRIESLTSRMGHAMRTHSARYILNHLKDNHHALFDRLPQSHRRHHHSHPALAYA